LEHRVARADDVPEGGGIAVDVGARRIAVFRFRGGFYALDETCPHRGGPLHEGSIENGVVFCPWHQWQFDLGTGCSPLNPLSRVRTYPVRVADGDVWLEVDDSQRA
jgi:nitrite reductase (NADH) small subunit/3-phenylpropionate/trans-cinnamate dioxygenase ferredoxin subunit